MQNLAPQVAIVTGSARGIGRGIAEVVAAAGATVVIADRDAELAAATAAELAADGMAADSVAIDVTDRGSVERGVASIAERHGRVDILAANAGIYPLKPIEQITDADWDLVMDVNARGVLHCVQAVLGPMRAAGYGRIVITSSITGPITGYPGFAHYGASKAAVLGLMRSAAIETATQGITINAVLPGNVKTPGLDEAGDEHQRKMMASIPLRDFADPADIGHAVRFLASPETRYITGQTIVVDGGQVLPETPEALG
ncbi:MAG: 3-oxoacyl-ACP reductase FabG [Baekduia sp.]